MAARMAAVGCVTVSLRRSQEIMACSLCRGRCRRLRQGCGGLARLNSHAYAADLVGLAAVVDDEERLAFDGRLGQRTKVSRVVAVHAFVVEGEEFAIRDDPFGRLPEDGLSRSDDHISAPFDDFEPEAHRIGTIADGGDDHRAGPVIEFELGDSLAIDDELPLLEGDLIAGERDDAAEPARSREGGGASPTAAFWRITVPIIFPAILSASLLAFALSIDDFVITFFTNIARFSIF